MAEQAAPTSLDVNIVIQLILDTEMEKVIKIAQIQKRPKYISTNKFATK